MRSESSDVLVVGAGPAGVAAALEAARCGRRVLMVDDNASPGGQIWRGGGSSAPPRARRLFEELEGAGVRRLGATTIVDARGPHRFVAHSEPSGETFDLCTDRVVLATGSRELFLPFPGWTLPGVHGAGGLQALAKGGWPVAGRRVVIAGSGPLLLAVAAYLRGAGAKIVAIVEQARMASLVGVAHALVAQPAKAWQALTLGAGLAGITKWYGAWPLRAEGETRLQRVVISRRGKEVALDCDLLACAFGLVANSEVAAFLGCQQREGATCVDELQRTSVDGVLAAGEATGIGGVDVALVEGRIAGCVAAGDEQRGRAFLPHAHAQRRFAARLNRAFELRPELRELATDDTVVCRCEDVRWGEVAPFDDARDAKLQTRCGMGPCQGRVCGPALRFVHGWGPDRIRPPFYPVPMAVLAEAGGAQRPGETP